jgi:serine/threonine protein kinase
MGVITYFLLAGYTPFDRESQQEEMEAIMRGDYRFEPEEYWANVSETARDFVRTCLTIDPRQRPTATEALRHPWLSETERHYVPDPSDPNAKTDLLPHIQKHFDAKKTCACYRCRCYRHHYYDVFTFSFTFCCVVWKKLIFSFFLCVFVQSARRYSA